MSKVLITGGCGFLGHHVVEHLLKNTDWDIIILDRLSYAAGMKNVAKINRVEDINIFKNEARRISFCWGDLAAPIVDSSLPELDYIIHLASETHVDASLKDSRRFVQSNVLGTANLLEYLRSNQPKVKKIINFSTDEVYGPALEGYAFKEWDTMRPSNPYAAAKAGQDMLAYSFAHAYRMPIVIARCMNIFGERQHPEKFVPKTIKAILEGKDVELHGSRQATSSRCWIHARNVADALLFLLTTRAIILPGDMFHIVGEEHEVLWMAIKIATVLGGLPYNIKYVDFHSCRPGHDLRYALDGSKLSSLGWKLPMSFDESLIKTVRWYLGEEHARWLN